jgi:hypothetical protein
MRSPCRHSPLSRCLSAILNIKTVGLSNHLQFSSPRSIRSSR